MPNLGRRASSPSHAMNGENQPLVTDEPIEGEDFKKIIDHFKGTYRINFKLMKKNQKRSTCTRLETLGCWPAVCKILSEHGSHALIKFNSCLVTTMKLVGIMLRSRSWPITFHTITAKDVVRLIQNWLLSLALPHVLHLCSNYSSFSLFPNRSMCMALLVTLSMFLLPKVRR